LVHIQNQLIPANAKCERSHENSQDKRDIMLYVKCFLISVLIIFSSSAFSRQAVKELVLYNWEAYMSEQILEAFYQETGYKVKQVYYDSDQLKDELIYTTGGKGIDLVVGTGNRFVQYIQKGELLAKIPNKHFPNIKHIDPVWLDKYPELEHFAPPMLWGTLGIIYRKDLVGYNITSWMDLFQPKESLQKKVVMLDDVREAMGSALLALGYSFNSSKPEHILAAGKLLKAQSPYLKSYSYVGITKDSKMLDDSVHMTLGYNGDAIVLKGFNKNIEYLVPKEGTAIWSDHIAVLEVSENKEMAFKFINFINDPKRAALLAEELGMASPNKSAEEHMSQTHLLNPLIYPPKELLEKSESYYLLPLKVVRMYNTTFNDAKQ